MRPAELGFRLRERARMELERRRIAGPGLCAPGNFRAVLQGEAARRFYPLCPPGVFKREYPGWFERAVTEADRLCRHEFKLLNYDPVVLEGGIDWHRDPITGQVWERRFWADYRPETDHGGRDAKRIHELNRHQHLPRLAKAFYLTGEERYAVQAVSQLENWIEQNPPGMGINWQSSLEIAIRAISWIWTLFLLRDSNALAEVDAQWIGDSLFAQLDHVHRFTSQYSSPNTHLLGEATALFMAGLVFGETASAWLHHGAAVLEEQAPKQILDDGVYGELSSYYHCYTLDFYMQALMLADRNGFAFSKELRDRVASMVRFLAQLTRPDGTIPLLGDDDGGRALALDRATYKSYTDGLAMGEALFGITSCFEIPEEALWLSWGGTGFSPQRGLQPPSVPEQLNGRPGRAEIPHAPEYLIQRSEGDHLVFDCGGLGMLTGGHSHADALSISLWSRGRDLLVDPGTFVYNCAPRWREYFRSTAAHNTVVIDGHDQAKIAGTFRWSTRWNSRLTLRGGNDLTDYIEAEHDAYECALQVVHRRRSLHVRGDYWVVVDDFRGSGAHEFDFAFHLGPKVEIGRYESHGTGMLVSEDEGLMLSMQASAAVSTDVLTATPEPVGGWASDGYGEKHPCRTIRTRLNSGVPAAAISIVAPHQTGAVFEPIEIDGAVACAFSTGLNEDIAVFSLEDRPAEIERLTLHGEFFWLRFEAGELRRVVAVRARSLTLGDLTVFNRSVPGEYFSPAEETICVPSAAF
jgi:hypothetical protein